MDRQDNSNRIGRNTVPEGGRRRPGTVPENIGRRDRGTVPENTSRRNRGTVAENSSRRDRGTVPENASRRERGTVAENVGKRERGTVAEAHSAKKPKIVITNSGDLGTKHSDTMSWLDGGDGLASADGKSRGILGDPFNMEAAGVTYIIDRFENYGNGNQSYVVPCHDATGGEYVLKIYTPDGRSGTNAEMARKLNLVQSINSKNLGRIIAHGDFDAKFFYSGVVKNGEYYYEIFPRYRKINPYAIWFRPDQVNNERWTNEYRNRLFKIITDLNEGLSALHNKDIKHADIKPDNIMYDSKNDALVLIDFGTIGIGGSVVNRGGETHDYSAPEDKLGFISAEGDYYSLGLSILEMIVGEFPYQDNKIIKDIGEKYGISYDVVGQGFNIPSKIPNYVKCLIQGMIYVSSTSNRKEIKANRWTWKKISEWLKDVGQGNLDKFRNFSLSAAGSQTGGASGGEIGRFLQPLELGIGISVTSLTDFADKYHDSDKWAEGIKYLRNKNIWASEHIVPANIREQYLNDILNDFQSPGQNDTLESLYFKFLMKFGTNKSDFIWKWKTSEQAKTKNLTQIARLIREEYLPELERKSNAIGDWRNASGDDKNKLFNMVAEWIGTGVLETYINATDRLNNTDKLHEMFKMQYSVLLGLAGKKYKGQNPKATLTDEEVSYLYRLCREILYEGKYVMENGMTFSDYESFASKVAEMSQDEHQINNLIPMMQSVTKGNSYKPDFYAWMSMHLGDDKVGNIKHKMAF